MKTMKSNIGGIRLKLGLAAGAPPPAMELPRDEQAAGHVMARVLAKTIAEHTVKILLEGEMLDPASASDELRKYGMGLENGRHIGQCILQVLFPDEGRLAMVQHWLNSQAHLHVWEMAHRIPPPEAFYKAHPEILEACMLCGAVILDASTPSTMTTGSINPLTGDLLAHWIQSELEYDRTELRPRFFFQVVIPPRLWPGIMRSHFRIDHVL
jgi:hypothetical protein